MSDVSGSSSGTADFLVVGLGGSAGSIPSFREFFRNVPADSGMAYVVILHLSPQHESRLADILQSAASIPVMQVQEQVKVEPNHVYVIPPNRSLAMLDGSLVVSDVKGYEERRAPIDIFFRTLADTHDSRAVCVIFSGTGADGSMGLRRVKEHNGLVLVQDPREAEFQEMPRNAIATGLADFVLPVSEMPRRMVTFRDQIHAKPPGAIVSSDHDEQALLDILTHLRLRTGHDFSNYKRATVLRRIDRRLAVREIQNLPDYADYLRQHAAEADALMRELLISVTNFFRDVRVFERVEEIVVPKILERKKAGDHVRIWVAGCATGEEAYSVAMIFADAAARLSQPLDLQIFATDLDADAIARARNGFYSAAETADVPPDRLRRFFVKEQDGYRVRRELRELVLFAHHNLIKDPPFSHLDFITCRNVLIYLNRTAQDRAMDVLHFALEPGGYLLLGTAESLDGASQLFSTADKDAHLFQTRAVQRPVKVPPAPAAPVTSLTDLRGLTKPAPEDRGTRTGRLKPIEVHQRVLEEYAPPSLIVDENQTIVHLSPRAGRYLEFAGGEASLDLLQVVRPELRIELRTALFQAEQTHSRVAARGISVHVDGRTETIDLIVHPSAGESDASRGYFLVIFEPSRRSEGEEERVPVANEPAARQLEEELIRIKSQMRATIEQYELQAEESKAANEELQAMNEELRSTAEELETSQEELQSVNEELQTVNQELKVKIEEIGHTNDDLRNLITSTEIGTVFVDRSLRVKLFTPRARDIFNLIAADVGRPLLDITSKITLLELRSDIEQVLDRLLPVEREVQTQQGSWYVMRLLPYRTLDDRIDGVVITFVDITERKEAEKALRESEHGLRSSRDMLERRVTERTRELTALSVQRQRLLERLVTATEEERKRIARELHDEMGQHITALKVGLEALAGKADVEHLRKLVSRLDTSIDRLTMELRPPVLDDLGIGGAVAALVDEFRGASGIDIDLHLAVTDGERMQPIIETALYRVIQEALTNIWKHARAKHVSVILKREDGGLQVIVEDDGAGFEVNESDENVRHGHGLIGIRERVSLIGGTMSIESEPGRDTTLYVRVPIADS